MSASAGMSCADGGALQGAEDAMRTRMCSAVAASSGPSGSWSTQDTSSGSCA